MLSYGEFLKKHEAKYSNLSRADKRRRYDSYKLSFQTQARPTRTNERSLARKRRLTSDDRSQRSTWSSEKDEMSLEYLRSTADPWNHVAMNPDPLSFEGVPIQIKFTQTLASDANGNAVFFMKDGISNCYAFTLANGGAASPTLLGSYRGISCTGADSSVTPGSYSFHLNNNPNLANGTTVVSGFEYAGIQVSTSFFDPVPSWSDVISTSTGWRPVSGGAKFSYVGAPLNAAGTIAAASYPASFGIASLNGMTFDQVAALGGAVTCEAREGVELRLVPHVTVPSWRPTKKAMPVVGINAWTTDFDDNIEIVDVQPPMTCDTDPDVWDAIWRGYTMNATSQAQATHGAPLECTTTTATNADVAFQPNFDFNGIDDATGMSWMANVLQNQVGARDMDPLIFFAEDTRAFAGNFMQRPPIPSSEGINVKALASTLPASSKHDPDTSDFVKRSFKTAADVGGLIRDAGQQGTSLDLAEAMDSIGAFAGTVGEGVLDALPEIALAALI